MPSGTGSFDRVTARLSVPLRHRARVARALQLPAEPDRAGDLYLLRAPDDGRRSAMARAGATVWALHSGGRATAGVWIRPFRVAVLKDPAGRAAADALRTVRLVQERDASRRATVAESMAELPAWPDLVPAAPLQVRLPRPQSAVVEAYAHISLAGPGIEARTVLSVKEWDLDVGTRGARLQWTRSLTPSEDGDQHAGGVHGSLEVYEDYRPEEVDFLLPALIANLSRLGVAVEDTMPWPAPTSVVRLPLQ